MRTAGHSMAKKFPLNPAHPERTCWGCDKFCPAHSLMCGNGSERTQHPAELFGEDWAEWGMDPYAPVTPPQLPAESNPGADPAIPGFESAP
jgi:hypothetical protein